MTASAADAAGWTQRRVVSRHRRAETGASGPVNHRAARVVVVDVAKSKLSQAFDLGHAGNRMHGGPLELILHGRAARDQWLP